MGHGRGGVLGRPDDGVVNNMSMKLEICNIERDENQTKDCDHWSYSSIYLALVLVFIPRFGYTQRVCMRFHFII